MNYSRDIWKSYGSYFEYLYRALDKVNWVIGEGLERVYINSEKFEEFILEFKKLGDDQNVDK